MLEVQAAGGVPGVVDDQEEAEQPFLLSPTSSKLLIYLSGQTEQALVLYPRSLLFQLQFTPVAILSTFQRCSTAFVCFRCSTRSLSVSVRVHVCTLRPR